MRNFISKTPPAKGPPPSPDTPAHGVRPAEERAARVAVRDGERAGTIEILSFDASGACTVHCVGGLALMSLNVKCAEAIRRGALT